MEDNGSPSCMLSGYTCTSWTDGQPGKRAALKAASAVPAVVWQESACMHTARAEQGQDRQLLLYSLPRSDAEHQGKYRQAAEAGVDNYPLYAY